MVLERQLTKMDSTVSGFEKQLTDDGAIPDKPSAIQTSTQEIQVKTLFILSLVECNYVATSNVWITNLDYIPRVMTLDYLSIFFFLLMVKMYLFKFATCVFFQQTMVFVFINPFKVMQLHITSRVLKSYV